MPHLITTSGNRIPLRADEGYVLGRGRECDIVVEDLTCSRRHALVAIDPDGDCTVEDLSSRNGTFVNGTAVEGKVAVRQGSRIRVGATVYLMQVFDGTDTVDLAETGTLTFVAPMMGKGDVDGGELSQYGIVELLRLLTKSRRDVSLHVALADDNAQVEIRNGRVVAAACAHLQGFNALVKLGRESNGIFWVVKCDEVVDQNVSEPPKHLLVELSRCLGHQAAAQ